MFGLLSYIFVLFTCTLLAALADPEVSSSLGKIVGINNTVQFGGSFYSVHEYSGIPFAKPIRAHSRFGKPELLTVLDSPFYAQNHGSKCPAVGDEDFDENCLFLNVYVPGQPSDKPSGHAVMIWIHGGSFQRGSGHENKGTILSLYGNIIVVTFNYRVGVLGFLSTGDENAPGNYGLWDQRLAFQWVQSYIADFGGNNQRVTIAGVSAGAMSVIQHGLIPDNNALFQRLISQSGSMTMPALDLDTHALSITLTLAEGLGCNSNSSADLLSCFRSKSVEQIFSAMKATGTEVSFFPIVDGDLIKRNPKYLHKLSKSETDFFRSLDILSGFNVYDGTVMLRNVYPYSAETMRPSRAQMDNQYLPMIMKTLYRRDFKKEILDLVSDRYTDWTDPDNYHAIRLQITKLLGDTNFGVPAIELARLHGNTTGNFMYHFLPSPSFRPDFSPGWIDAAGHGEEIEFVFGSIGIRIGIGKENAWEIDLATKIMTFWSNFVKSGNPNEPELITPTWPVYNPKTDDYLILEKSLSNDSVRKYLLAEEANFWLKVYPDLINLTEEEERQEIPCVRVTSVAGALHVHLLLYQMTTLFVWLFI